jgi:Rad3-related DNA helicase
MYGGKSMTETPPALPQPYRVAVRALCEFTAKTGDLDLRFTPSPTAQEGIAGHALVASRRSATYQKEVPLSGSYRNLSVHGRADGFDPQQQRLEEFKTYRGDLQRQPSNHRDLHWAQLKIYGWLLCQQLKLDSIELALVYLDIGSQKETVFEQRCQAAELQLFFEQQCEQFLSWAQQEMAHRHARDETLQALVFPYQGFRTGQRQLAEATYRAACSGGCLMLQAPTGIGKTIGTLFPLLKAMPGQALDRVFFLTAKTPGRALALGALQTLGRDGLRQNLRVLEMVARDKACEHPDKACHGESCPLAQGFYDRLSAARDDAVVNGWMDQNSIRTVARNHQICPYYLSQELARWSDVVVADYNYYFDVSALLFSLAQNSQWQVAILVDEAHNLIERGRKMYSATLDQADLQNVRKTAPATVKRSLDQLNRTWNKLSQAQHDVYQAYEELPEAFLAALQKTVSKIGDDLAEHPENLSGDLQRFYFDALHFMRMAEMYGEHSLFDISKQPVYRGSLRNHASLCLRNIQPGAFLSERFAASHSSILFSATLTPQKFYQDLLGLPDKVRWLEIDSPFDASQLTVHLVDQISTRYQHRAASQQPIVDILARQFYRQPGNYLMFCSSFDYLQQIDTLLQQCHPDIPRWSQIRRMDEAARQIFIDRFAEGGQGISFAVLGGAFGEGIDLPGQRLIGAFIATLGLPQLNPVNEQIKRRLDELFDRRGYDYAYLYPGIQKVIQAAGRVIRTPQDCGVVYLIDDRFASNQVKKLLPSWWHIQQGRIK